MKQPRLRTIPSRLGTVAPRVKVPEKEVDPYYNTPQHKAWRAEVLRNAGYQCQWVENGKRCTNAAPKHRLFADHIVERTDGGSDLGEGQCLCGTHHTIKTVQERQKRMSQ